MARIDLIKEEASRVLDQQLDRALRRIDERKAAGVSEKKAALLRLEALLHLYGLDGKGNLPYRAFEYEVAIRSGDRTRAVAALMKSSALYRKLLRIIRSGASYSSRQDTIGSIIVGAGRLHEKLRKLSPNAAARSETLFEKERRQLRIDPAAQGKRA